MAFLLAHQILKNHARAANGKIRFQEHFLIAVIRVFEHALLLFQSELVLLHDIGEHFGDVRGGLLVWNLCDL